MINLYNDEIKKLECIGKGGCGVLYRKDDLVYKIYKKVVNTSYYEKISNPSLKYRSIRINRLMKLDKKLLYTDLIKDVIFINGKFAGVVFPYYDGVTLYDSKNLSFRKRVTLSFELVRNVRELMGFFIYPMDHKLDNVMLVDDHIKLIDLDDALTKVNIGPHPLCQKKCIANLDSSIKSFLNESNTFPSSYFSHLISKTFGHVNHSFDDINNYLDSKNKSYPYVILYENSDVYSNIRLFRDSRVRVLYAIKKIINYDDLSEKITRFGDAGISIYDIVFFKNLDDYLQNVSYKEVLEVNGTLLQKRMVCR